MKRIGELIGLSSLLVAGCLVNAGGGDDDDDDDDSGGCSESFDDCSGESICIDGACEDAFGRRYRFSGIAVSIPDRNLDGEPWDAAGGAPDPFVEVWLNDNDLVLRTGVVDDVFDASFSETGDGTISAGDSLFIDVLDEDLTSNDPVYSCQGDPLGAGLLRQRALRCDSDGYTVELEVDPR